MMMMVLSHPWTEEHFLPTRQQKIGLIQTCHLTGPWFVFRPSIYYIIPYLQGLAHAYFDAASSQAGKVVIGPAPMLGAGQIRSWNPAGMWEVLTGAHRTTDIYVHGQAHLYQDMSRWRRKTVWEVGVHVD